jgi:hypothetical protein
MPISGLADVSDCCDSCAGEGNCACAAGKNAIASTAKAIPIDFIFSSS